jgi:hypothetical protein
LPFSSTGFPACAPSNRRHNHRCLALPRGRSFRLSLWRQLRAKHLSHLRRWPCLSIAHPGLPPWASLCRAYGAHMVAQRWRSLVFCIPRHSTRFTRVHRANTSAP